MKELNLYRVGYKEPDTVDTKKATPKDDGKGDKYIEEELPTVVMEGSSATEEEYKRYMKEIKDQSEGTCSLRLLQFII